MKTKLLKVALVSSAVLTVFGCAHQSQRPLYEINYEAIAEVERSARRASSNVDVIWVNYPRKRVGDKKD